MLDVTLTVNLTLKGPILTQSTAAGAYGVDSSMARNANGKCYLAGTLVKGRLRQAWEELQSVPGSGFNPRINEWLGEGTGSPNNRNTPIAPSRGRLSFQNFEDSADRRQETLYRISIDDQRGAVRKGAYQVIEAPYAPGEEATFTGVIRYFANDVQEADEIRRCVEIGLRWITSFGAERTVGFGRLGGVAVTENRQTLPVTVSLATSGAQVLEFELTAKSPLCIARRRVDNNLFESEEMIPGGVLKGCVASSWRTSLGHKSDGEIAAGMDKSRPELCQHFEKLRFTHAFPGSADQKMRPVVAPLSLVKDRAEQVRRRGQLMICLHCPLSLVKDRAEQVRDVALCDGPILLGDPLAAPRFAIDWKSNDDVQGYFGWPMLRRELRVRTSIDKGRRKAKEEQLFAYEMISPRDDLRWYGQIDLSQIPDSDRSAVEAQLRGILSQGIYSLGKTKAHAEAALHSAGTIQPRFASDAAARSNQWILTLQTPALLCDPARLDEKSGRDELFEAYREVWDQLSNRSLQLARFFAQQSLAGGFYLHRRFQPGKAYNPYLLTDAGSVFVLRANKGQEAQAQQYIGDWLAHGLPLPQWAIDRYARDGRPGNHWTNCPYLPANGYGEIAVNLDVHWSKRPQEGEFYAI